MGKYRPKPCADCPGRQSLMCCRRPSELPLGNYSMTIERIRKVRNKNAYRFHYVLEDGTRQSMVMKL